MSVFIILSFKLHQTVYHDAVKTFALHAPLILKQWRQKMKIRKVMRNEKRNQVFGIPSFEKVFQQQTLNLYSTTSWTLLIISRDMARPWFLCSDHAPNMLRSGFPLLGMLLICSDLGVLC